jgi:hypothetical protein
MAPALKMLAADFSAEPASSPSLYAVDSSSTPTFPWPQHRLNCVVSFMPRPLYHREKGPPVPNGQEAEWAPLPTNWSGRQISYSCQNWKPDPSAIQPSVTRHAACAVVSIKKSTKLASLTETNRVREAGSVCLLPFDKNMPSCRPGPSGYTLQDTPIRPSWTFSYKPIPCRQSGPTSRRNFLAKVSEQLPCTSISTSCWRMEESNIEASVTVLPYCIKMEHTVNTSTSTVLP